MSGRKQPLVEVRNLKKYFPIKSGMMNKTLLKAVDDVSFSIDEGETLGLVGESGCGKTTVGRTLLHLYTPTSGEVYFDGKRVTEKNIGDFRKDMQIVFQDPYSSLNPRQTVEETIREPLLLTHRYSRKQIDDEVTSLMELCGVEERLRLAYPHEMDGGRRQRVGIARALALNPDFVVCDEPVSALDVSIQAQVLNLLKDLQKKKGLTYMFVTHDLSVVRHISNDIGVMYLGQMVETSESRELFVKPLHPYTKALLSAIPSIDIHHPQKRIVLKGEITSPINPKPGCRFAARCPYAGTGCDQPQHLEEILPGHFVSCHRCREINNL